MNRFLASSIFLAFVFFSPFALGADDTDAILKKAFEKSMIGTSQGTADLKMIISDPQGNKKERILQFKARSEQNLLQYLIQFKAPADIKGTSFLVKERKGQLPAQYVYIPAAKVVRSIAGGNAKSSFFGSDFIYADLLPYPKDKKDEVSVKRLPDDILGGQPVFAVEITPKMAESPYSKLLIYIQKDQNIATQIKFFDKTNQLLKTLKVRKLKKVEGKLVPVDIEMKNEQTKSYTTIVVDNINSKAKLSADDFTEAAMQR